MFEVMVVVVVLVVVVPQSSAQGKICRDQDGI